MEGRPLGELTVQFLEWLCGCVAQERKHVLVVIWDNASWHTSEEVAGWVKAQNQQAKRGKGGCVVICELPAAKPLAEQH